MSTVLFLGGILNIVDPFIGLQLYIWLWILILFFTIGLWIAFRYGVWEKYRAMWGIYYAYKAVSKAAFIFNLELVLELWSEARAKCIFDYSKIRYTGFDGYSWSEGGPLRSWIEKRIFNYATVYLPDLDPMLAILYRFGNRNMDVEIATALQNGEWDNAPSSVGTCGIDADIILDADSWTVAGSRQHKEIEIFCEMHNSANKTDQIHSYMKFQRLLLENTIRPGGAYLQNIKPMVIVPWSRIDAVFPIFVKDNEEGGARRQQAKDEDEADKNEFSKYIPYVLGGGFLFALGVLAARMAMIFFTHKPPT